MHRIRVARALLLLPLLALAAAAASRAAAQSGAAPGTSAGEARSGTSFLSGELQARQHDSGANPGMLWVGQGEKLWSAPTGAAGRSCASCHGDAAASMGGVAARYPAIDAETGDLLNLELRINRCRGRHMQAAPLAWESDELISLTAWVAHLSRGTPIAVSIDGAARRHFEAGRTFYETRQGQLNIACTQCHDQSVGRRLRGDTISQGHPTGFPIYRIEWQTAGSLHRRLRACSLGVRAEVLDYGAPEYLALELYLAWRARGLPVETPAIRR